METINLILDWFSSIPQDKLLHFVAGMIIYLVFYIYNYKASTIASAVIPLLKELFDINRSGFDINDALVTMWGSLTSAILLYFIVIRMSNYIQIGCKNSVLNINRDGPLPVRFGDKK